ncbi:MAG: redox-sensing transcriptional repressor Rex [Tissierellia bacterium]|nr:redox-sensing transcriptional repressor Rex [Tissierellia bacterium]MDD4725803.1 redox-sensing transcriptional repressor Rex [Tissierellia bacterium]
MERDTQVSITVIRRLPKYHRYLSELKDKGINRISSQELSKLTGFTASQIRQDLNNFGGFGQQGYGYNVDDLYKELGKILGVDRDYTAVIAGTGNLGHAIANYKGINEGGFKILSLFDRNPNVIGKEVSGVEVRDINLLEEYISENNIDIGIITVPKEGAQPIADRLVKAGVRGIWNFAPTDLIVPKNVIVENVRLKESILILSYFLSNQENKNNK